MTKLGPEVLRHISPEIGRIIDSRRVEKEELKAGRLLVINATDARDSLPAIILLRVVYTQINNRYQNTILQYCGAVGTPFHFYESFGPGGDAQPIQIAEGSLLTKGMCGFLVPRQRLNMAYCDGGIEVGGRDLMLEYVNGGPKFVVVHKVVGVGILEAPMGYKPPDVQSYLKDVERTKEEERARR